MVEAAKIDPAYLRAHALIESLWLDKDMGPKLRKAAKEKFPEIQIPEETTGPMVEPLRAEIAALNERLAKVDKEREEEAKERRDATEFKSLQDKIQAARDKFSLTDEGLDKMVARMKETGNAVDPEAAAAWVAQQLPKAPKPGTTFGPQSLNLFGSKEKDDRFALLHRDPQEYADREMQDFFADPDKYVRETLGQAA